MYHMYFEINIFKIVIWLCTKNVLVSEKRTLKWHKFGQSLKICNSTDKLGVLILNGSALKANSQRKVIFSTSFISI